MSAIINQYIPKMITRRPLWQLLLGGYLILLAISYLIQFAIDSERPLRPGQRLINVTLTKAGASSQKNVTIAYTDSLPLAHNETPVILLLHGSPIAAHPTFKNLKVHLTPIGRIIAPDMPGFGASDQSIPDYSIRAHADYILKFIDRLNTGKVHIVAYSMGGGVALHMVHKAPQRIQSLVMLSSIGVQELELLGDYYLNHTLHSAKLAGL